MHVFRILRWQLICAFVVGISLRTIHYLRCPSVWHDEAAMIVNILKLEYRELLGPLLHSEAAPPLFLGIERAVVSVMGDSEYAFRLFPFAASCLALGLFIDLAKRLLSRIAAIFACYLMAISDRLLFHAVEAKTYSIDVLFAVVSVWWFDRSRQLPIWKSCLPIILGAPFMIWLSFPSCFVLGGFLVGILLRLWYERPKFFEWLIAASMVSVVAIAFLALMLGPIRAQRDASMESCWTTHFPNLQQPVSVPYWLIQSTLEVARYCYLPVGQLVGVLAIIGGYSFVKRPSRRNLTIVVLTVPFVLVLIATFLHQYPYGGTRLEIFLAPLIAILSGEGTRRLIGLFVPKHFLWAATLGAVLVGPPMGLAIYRIWVPWPRAACRDAAEFVIQSRRPDDLILMNHWEYEYYLRHLPEHWNWIDKVDLNQVEGSRIFVIYTSLPAVEELPFSLPINWRREMLLAVPRTRVFLLTRKVD